MVTVALLLVIIIISAVFHPPLYFLLPLSLVGYVWGAKLKKFPFNKYVVFSITIIAILLGFLVIDLIKNPELSYLYLKGFLRYVGYICFALVVLNFNEKTFHRFFISLAILFVITLPLAVLQMKSIGRFQSFFSHANPFAYSMVYIMYFLYFKKPSSKQIRFLLLTLLFIALILTKTSGAFIAIMLLLVYNFIVSSKVTLLQKVISFVILLIVIPSSFLFIPKLQSQFSTLEIIDKDFIKSHVWDFRPGGKGSLVWRVIYWAGILTEFFKENFINRFFGLGIDVFTKEYYPYDIMEKDPHNDFLKVLVEYGYVGFTLFISFLVSLFILLKKNFNLIILIFVPLFFDNTLVNFTTILIFIILAAYEYKFGLTKGN